MGFGNEDYMDRLEAENKKLKAKIEQKDEALKEAEKAIGQAVNGNQLSDNWIKAEIMCRQALQIKDGENES